MENYYSIHLLFWIHYTHCTSFPKAIWWESETPPGKMFNCIQSYSTQNRFRNFQIIYCGFIACKAYKVFSFTLTVIHIRVDCTLPVQHQAGERHRWQGAGNQKEEFNILRVRYLPQELVIRKKLDDAVVDVAAFLIILDFKLFSVSFVLFLIYFLFLPLHDTSIVLHCPALFLLTCF